MESDATNEENPNGRLVILGLRDPLDSLTEDDSDEEVLEDEPICRSELMTL